MPSKSPFRGINDVPADIFLEIFKYCHSFSSLWTLISISHRAQTVFESFCSEIVERFIQTVSPEIAVYMRVILALRTSSFQLRTLKEARQFPNVTPRYVLRDPPYQPSPDNSEIGEPDENSMAIFNGGDAAWGEGVDWGVWDTTSATGDSENEGTSDVSDEPSDEDDHEGELEEENPPDDDALSTDLLDATPLTDEALANHDSASFHSEDHATDYDYESSNSWLEGDGHSDASDTRSNSSEKSQLSSSAPIERFYFSEYEEDRKNEAWVWPSIRSCKPNRDITLYSVLRQFVKEAHCMHILAQDCLNSCLATCRSQQPFRWATQPAGDLVGVDDFTWIEEQRALYGLWARQYYAELQKARVESQLPWPQEDLDKLSQLSLPSFFNKDVPGELAATAEAVLEGYLCPGTHFGREFDLDKLLHRTKAQPPPASPPNLFPTMRMGNNEKSLRYRLRRVSKLKRRRDHSGFRVLPRRRGQWFDEATSFAPWRVREQLTWAYVDDVVPFACTFYNSFGQRSASGRLQQKHRIAFRKFGFVFWETCRIVDMGLWMVGGDSDHRKYYQRWETLLAQEHFDDDYDLKLVSPESGDSSLAGK